MEIIFIILTSFNRSTLKGNQVRFLWNPKLLKELTAKVIMKAERTKTMGKMGERRTSRRIKIIGVLFDLMKIIMQCILFDKERILIIITILIFIVSAYNPPPRKLGTIQKFHSTVQIFFCMFIFVLLMAAYKVSKTLGQIFKCCPPKYSIV